jgi:hypothetical protein
MEVIITKMAGDGKFWYNRIIDMMEAMKNDGWYHCMFSTNRNPDAFKRFVGGNLVMSREENGQMIHYFDWTLETGHGRYGNG